MGCSRAPKVARPEASSEETIPKKVQPRGIETGRIGVIQRGENREPHWAISAERSEVTYDANGKLKGRVYKVMGQLYQGGKVVSDFKADVAVADQIADTLELSGSVILTSKTDESTLRADAVRWLRDRELVEASGKVQVETPAYRLGPCPTLWADPKLQHIGTPDRFKR